MIILNDIQRMLQILSDLQTDLEEESKNFPEGNLYCYNSRGTRNYCERIPKGGNRKKERRIGVGRDVHRLHMLVRKGYVKRAIPLIKKNVEICKDFLDRYNCVDENSVMNSFVQRFPELATLIYNDDINEEWENDYSRDKTLHAEDLKSLSADGTEMRSLGEIIISSRLKHYGIPYRYEAEIGHPDISYVPDFTIKRPRDGKIIYWEHLGKVNDEDYLKKNKTKFDVYEMFGIVPWDNLIISYSQANGGINEKLIDSLIQGWLM